MCSTPWSASARITISAPLIWTPEGVADGVPGLGVATTVSVALEAAGLGAVRVVCVAMTGSVGFHVLAAAIGSWRSGIKKGPRRPLVAHRHVRGRFYPPPAMRPLSTITKLRMDVSAR